MAETPQEIYSPGRQLDSLTVDLTNNGVLKATNHGVAVIFNTAIQNAGGRITAENKLANYVVIGNFTLTSGFVGAEGGGMVSAHASFHASCPWPSSREAA